MGRLLQLGDILATNAYLFPDKVGARDLTRSLTFRVWNERACKLANALLGLGLGKGDRIAVLAYNCLEPKFGGLGVFRGLRIIHFHLHGRRFSGLWGSPVG